MALRNDLAIFVHCLVFVFLPFIYHGRKEVYGLQEKKKKERTGHAVGRVWIKVSLIDMMHAMQDDDCHMLSLRSTPQSNFYNLPTPILLEFQKGKVP